MDAGFYADSVALSKENVNVFPEGPMSRRYRLAISRKDSIVN
jgi:hypothetical protein